MTFSIFQKSAPAVAGLTALGIPTGSILGALVLELAIAALCLAAFGRPTPAGKHRASQHV